MLLQRMILLAFAPILLGMIVMLSLMLEVADVVPNLHRYFTHKVPMAVIGRIAALYLPKCIALSIPFALLFSVLYTLGGFHASNEVIGVLCAGVSLRRLTMPLLICGVVLSAVLFVFDDSVVVHTMRMKNQAYRAAIGIGVSLDDRNVVAVTPDRKMIYYADFYDDENAELKDLTIIELHSSGSLLERVDAERAYWENGRWVLEKVRRFTWSDTVLLEHRLERYEDGRGTTPSRESFRFTDRDVSEMTYLAATKLVDDIRGAGREYHFVLTDVYGKIAFVFTPLLLTGVAIGLGGLIRKNVVLTSLLLATALAVVFSVVTTIGTVLSKNGYLPPAVGAFGGDLLFFFAGAFLFVKART